MGLLFKPYLLAVPSLIALAPTPFLPIAAYSYPQWTHHTVGNCSIMLAQLGGDETGNVMTS